MKKVQEAWSISSSSSFDDVDVDSGIDYLYDNVFALSNNQGRSWGNWLEKYIVVEVYLRAEKYNLSPQKSIFRQFLPEITMFHQSDEVIRESKNRQMSSHGKPALPIWCFQKSKL